MELASINSPAAAFMAGLVVSLHCAGMCGPLACLVMPAPGDRTGAPTVATAYHLARLGGYGALGALAGGAGMMPLGFLSGPALRWLPWMLVLFFLSLAFHLDRFLPKPLLVGGWLLRLNGKLRGRSRVTAATALGLATPLLPCGPLYFLIALALLSGSAVHGAEFMLAFGLGTLPLLWLVQTQFSGLRGWLTPLWLGRVRIVLALTAALVLAWRLRGTLGLAGPSANGSVCF
ncbi:MAG: sulfite exporter TauE/SafE family protein [Opitutaceae bacterium]|jgi:sulfite exporter TauE/SafE